MDFATAVIAELDGRELDHTNLTSLFYPRGVLRVHYLGVRFDADEFRGDLLELVEKLGLASKQ